MSKEIILGCKAKDKISGIEGIATIKSTHLNGCTRYFIQPPVKKKNDTEVPEGFWIDEEEIIYIDVGHSKTKGVLTSVKRLNITLGEKIKDLVTGISGIATSKTEFMNGCVQYAMKLKAKKGDTKLPKTLWFDEEQLSIVGKGIIEKKKVSNTGGAKEEVSSKGMQRI